MTAQRKNQQMRERRKDNQLIGKYLETPLPCRLVESSNIVVVRFSDL